MKIKNLLAFISILIIFSDCVAQDDFCNLSKYSYLVVGFYDIKIVDDYQSFKATQGTCFFVRKNNKLFLISAKHLLTSWNPETSTKNMLYPDKLNLRLFDTNDKVQFYVLDIKDINKAIEGAYTYNDPDVFIIEFEDDPKYKINSIEKFIDDEISITQESNIRLYGYPTTFDFFGEEQMKALPSLEPTLVEGKPLSKDSPYRDIRIRQLENLNYAIQRTDTLPRAGCSGAPVFVETKKGWGFGGIFINSSPEVPISLILRNEFILPKIDEKFKSNK